MPVVCICFFYLASLQNDANVTSQCVQLRFGDRRVVLRKLVGVLPELKKRGDEREKTYTPIIKMLKNHIFTT